MSDLPIWIIEPEQNDKRDLAADRLVRGAQKSAHVPLPTSIKDLKSQIKALRENARDNIDSLIDRLQASLSKRYPSARVTTATDYISVAGYISQNSGTTKTISTNNSVTVQELRPELVRAGYTVINSYHHEFEVKEKKILDYWDLPRLLDKNLPGTFGVAARIDGLSGQHAKDYIALLGVNAASAEDGTILFLEHFSNILKDIQQAGKVVLVIGLDKIVPTRADAIFQTQCMGVFGLENILLGVEPRPVKTTSIDELSLPVVDTIRELHVIILDNGRRKIIDTKYKDLFLCIGCRACNKHCPIRHSLTDSEFIWTPKTYLTHFLYGKSESVDVCLHCEACRIECPVDIDLPYLMWQAKLDFVAKHGTSLSHKMLGRPEILAKLGTAAAPLSNWAMHRRLVRVPMEKITGIDKRTGLPTFHRRTFRKRIKQKNG
jgi:L-lactate utilization protein LutB